MRISFHVIYVKYQDATIDKVEKEMDTALYPPNEKLISMPKADNCKAINASGYFFSLSCVSGKQPASAVHKAIDTHPLKAK